MHLIHRHRVEQFPWGGGFLSLQRAGLHRRHATASWTCFLKLIKLLPPSPSPPPPKQYGACACRSNQHAPATLEKEAEKTTLASWLHHHPATHTGSTSGCVRLHSTCHAASLRRLCICAQRFSNRLMGVKVKPLPLPSLWFVVMEVADVMASPGAQAGFVNHLVASDRPPPLVSFPLACPPRAVCDKTSRDDHTVPLDGVSSYPCHPPPLSPSLHIYLSLRIYRSFYLSCALFFILHVYVDEHAAAQAV